MSWWMLSGIHWWNLGSLRGLALFGQGAYAPAISSDTARVHFFLPNPFPYNQIQN
jgi:hypothetical protein